ncbi:hypothetical protein [Phytohabitans suffuscus]|uniref:Uncharacterized protein n=1 Tax=Phytohabitans suffuscus TaxID=624315 RepID=A0A6F8Y9U5_9ACTN|nr:hypothetical protein [Phytohabitans suffuscus]BCB82882.1 hypothetical protein Psuf_001950 [Phytohabitans suffuscus]
MAEDVNIDLSSDSVEVKAKVRLPKGYNATVSEDGDVEGHEFEEEDPLERAIHVNVGCCG